MKKQILLFILSMPFFCFLQAQDQVSMIGLSTTYEKYQYHSNWWSEDKKDKSFTFGLEYSESKRFFGYRAGLFYTRIKDQTIYDFEDDFFQNILIDIWIAPQHHLFEIIDFPISGQLYLPLGVSKIKLYGNLGLITSLSFFDAGEINDWYGTHKDSKSLSFRGIYGGGIVYQFAKHFGIDLSVNKKRRLYTIDDNFIKPNNSLSFQTKLNYIF